MVFHIIGQKRFYLRNVLRGTFHDRCIWKLAKLPPRKYYEYLKTGIYPEPEKRD